MIFSDVVLRGCNKDLSRKQPYDLAQLFDVSVYNNLGGVKV